MTATPEQSQRHKVLVVDDNEIVADTMTLVLTFGGFDAIGDYDPHHALSLAETGSFDLLLTDVMMPRMSGIELAIAASEAGFVAKVLLMSGVDATTDLLEDARGRGYAFEILPKPTNASEIIAKVGELLQ